MSLNDATLRQAISTVVDPHTGQDFVASKALKALRITGADVSVEVELAYPAKSLFPTLRQQLVTAIKQVPGVGQVTVQLSSRIVAHAALSLHILGGHAEDHDVVTAHMLQDFDIGAVQRADGQGAIHGHLHVSGSRGFLAGG